LIQRLRRIKDFEEIGYLEDKWSIEKETASEKRLSDILKKQTLKNFYYVNEHIVNQLYNQMPPILEPKEINVQTTTGSQTGGSLNIPLVQLKGEKTQQLQISELYQKKEPSLEIKYSRLQEYLVKYDYVLLGLEEFEYNTYLFESFNETCEKINKKFDFMIPQGIKEEFVSKKMNEYALEYIDKFFNIQGFSTSKKFIIVIARFTPIEINEKLCSLLFKHPLNKHLLNKELRIQIQIDCIKDVITKRGITYFKKGEPITITCLGSIVNLTDNILKVEPIAIY